MVFKRTSSSVYLFHFLWAAAHAVPIDPPPAEIAARTEPTGGAPGSRNYPHRATFDVSGWQNIAESNCYIMLCQLGGQLTWQRGQGGTMPEDHRNELSIGLHPFYAQNLSDRHTSQITSETTSPEEFPWASLMAGGWNAQTRQYAHVMPATLGEQNAQSSQINAGYVNAGVDYEHWLTISFSGYDTSKTFCRALFSVPQDVTVCRAGQKTDLYGQSVAPEDYDFQKVPDSNPVIWAKDGDSPLK